MKSPTATVSIGGKDFTVAFDLNRLMAIEDGTQTKVYELISEFSTYFAFGTKDKAPTTAELTKAAKNFSVRKALAFVAACLDMSPKELGQVLPVKDLRVVSLGLASGLSQAVRQLNGVDEAAAEPAQDDAPRPIADPQTSSS